MSEKIDGYWSISVQKHLKSFATDSIGLDELDDIDSSGKSGRLLGAIRGNGQINNIKKVEKLGNTVGIRPRELHQIILPQIERVADGKIELIKDTTNQIIGIQEYVFSNDEVLDITGQVFNSLNPSAIQKAVIETLNHTKSVPYYTSELYSLLGKSGFKDNDISNSLGLQNQFKLIQKLDKISKKDPIISNEYVWGANHDKIAYALSKSSMNDKQSIKEVIDEIQAYQGLSSEDINEQKKSMLFLMINSGMINPVNIISSRGFTKDFLFSSDVLNPMSSNDDIMDDVKVLLASIRFGERFTEHSTIQQPIRFLNALLDNGTVGPHSANLTDYILLEKKGIVKIVEQTKIRNGRYGSYKKKGPCIQLIKEDVAEKAIEVISNMDMSVGNYNEDSAVLALGETGSYENPEEIRVKIAEVPHEIAEAQEMLNMSLRDETI